MALFAEWSRDTIAAEGRVGLIVPTGIATDSFNQQFFRDGVNKQCSPGGCGVGLEHIALRCRCGFAAGSGDRGFDFPVRARDG